MKINLKLKYLKKRLDMKALKGLKFLFIIIIIALTVCLTVVLFYGTDANYNIEFYLDDVLVFHYISYGSDKIDINKFKPHCDSLYKFDGWYFDKELWNKEFTSLHSVRNFSFNRPTTIKVYAKLTAIEG